MVGKPHGDMPFSRRDSGGDKCMKAERIDPNAPHLQAAVAEIQGLIQQHYPTASFQVMHGEDPEGMYMIVTVDVEDTDVVVDVYIDRLLELQINDGLPVYVVPVRPLARVAELRPGRDGSAEEA
jgi:hypothetical protein